LNQRIDVCTIASNSSHGFARFVRTLPIPNQPASHHVSWRSANAQVRAKTAMRSKHKHQESIEFAGDRRSGRTSSFDKLAAYAAQIAKERSA